MGTEIHLDEEGTQRRAELAVAKEQARLDARRKREQAYAEAVACGGFHDKGDEVILDSSFTRARGRKK